MTTPASPETRGWRVGRFGGAPVIVTPGWGIIAIVLVVAFAPWIDARLGLGPMSYVGATAIPVLLFVSVLLHELAHGLVARRLGVEVGEYVVSLWGGHTAFTGAIRRPGASAAIAVAGPLTNAVLAVIFFLLARNADGVTALALSAATYSNAVVAVFNLLPALPMDGGKLLEALIWKVRGDRLGGTIAAGRLGQVLAIALPVVLVGYPFLRGSRPDIFTAVWAVLLGSVLWTGARASVRAANAQRSAGTVDLRRLAVGVHVLPALAWVADLDRARSAAPAAPTVLVDNRGMPVALVSAPALDAVPAEGRGAVPLSAVAAALPPGAVVTEHVGPRAVAQVARAAQAGAAVVVLVDLSTSLPQVLGVVPVALVAQELAPGRRVRAT